MADSIMNLGNELNILTLKPDWVSPIKTKSMLNRQIMYTVPGAAKISNVEGEFRGYPISFEMQFTNMTKADEHALLDFFTSRQGRLKRFWCPHWAKTFTIEHSKPIGFNNFYIRDIHFRDTWIPYYTRLFFYFKDSGDMMTRRIFSLYQGVGADDWLERLVFASNFSHALVDSNIAYLSYLILARFDIDKLEIEHVNAKSSRCTVRVVELLGEYNNVGW